MKIVVQTGDESLKNQMQMLLETRAGSVPVDRDFGIRWEGLDELPEVAESLFYQEVLKKQNAMFRMFESEKLRFRQMQQDL